MKIACLGDSITNLGDGRITYADLLGSESFPLTVQNVGRSGSTISKQSEDGSFLDRYPAIDDDADIILVFGGTNDYGHSENPAPLEDPAGDPRSPHSFRGAFALLMDGLRERYPKALLCYLPPIPRNDVWWSQNKDHPLNVGGRNIYGCTLDQYRETAVSICRERGIPVIDASSLTQLDPADPVLGPKYYWDGLHLNDAGAALLAAFLTEALQALTERR